jgi:choline-sulfatase
MRILYIDIDTLRSDHLGCYGYPRQTSPNIDHLAARGVRFSRCYASDVPCLPSRTALFSGRFGTRNGVVSHGGTASEPFVEGPGRGFFSLFGKTAWPQLLRKLGLHTATISSFPARHSAYHFCAGFDEVRNPGKLGLESADVIYHLAEEWLSRNGARDHWFLHVHLWDPHTPYRAPDAYGDPFSNDPLPSWLTEEVRAAHFAGVGPHSAQEAVGFSTEYPYGAYPRQPRQIPDMNAVRQLFDGYDTGVRYADDHVGRLLEVITRLGVASDTAVLVSSDHGEMLGELNVYGDHHTADEHTAHVPFVFAWPGLAPRVHEGLCYPLDVAASVVELLGGIVPPQWDGRSFAPVLRDGREDGRDELVITQGAWTCQRGLRWKDYLYLRTYHDGYHAYPDEQLFDVVRDPHEQNDLVASAPALVVEARRRLAAWRQDVMNRHPNGCDPLETVLAEGGPSHTRGKLPAYLERLRATGRATWADRLAARHPREAMT